jgi:hypothetical protein
VQLLQRPSSSEVPPLLLPCRGCTSCYKGDLRLPILSIQLISYEEQFRACSRMSRSQIINIVGVVFAAMLLFVYIPSLTLAQPGALLDVVWVVAEYFTRTCCNSFSFKVHIGVFMKLGHMRSHISVDRWSQAWHCCSIGHMMLQLNVSPCVRGEIVECVCCTISRRLLHHPLLSATKHILLHKELLDDSLVGKFSNFTSKNRLQT